MTAGLDPFRQEREILQGVAGELADRELGVALGEYVADRMLGDPGLRRSLQLANMAGEALRIAQELVDQAVAAIPPQEVPNA